MRAPLAVLALTAVLAGCGSDDGPAERSDGAGGDLAALPADQLLERAASALERVRSYRVEARETDGDGPLRATANVAAAGDAALRFRQGRAAFEVRVVGDGRFLRANRAFWSEQGGPSQVTDLVADRWVVAPEGGRDLAEAVDRLRPKELAFCLRKETGGVTKHGVREVDGRRLVVLVDDGKRPGGAPGELFLDPGTALPVLVRQTGPQRPGRPDPRCGDADDDSRSSEVRFTRIDEPVRVQAPQDPVDLEQAAGAAQGGQAS
jgi:hypothetical protein